MATIFYHQDTGSIYGVHPDSNIEVPSGIASIDVAGLPDKINWPQLPGGTPGSEHTSKVVGGSLVVDPGLVPPKPPLDAEDIWRVLRAKGVVTDNDVPTARRTPL